MSFESPAAFFPQADAGRFTALRLGFQGLWSNFHAGLRFPGWPIIVGALLILGLLLAFHDVVSEAAKKGDLRRKADALFAQATWRCNTAQAMSARDNCLLQLNAAFGADPLLFAPDVVSALPLK